MAKLILHSSEYRQVFQQMVLELLGIYMGKKDCYLTLEVFLGLGRETLVSLDLYRGP